MSIREKSDKYKGLFDKGKIDRPDEMSPPFIKFFDVINQMKYPKTLVLGNQNYIGKPCFDGKANLNNTGIRLAFDMKADYYSYDKILSISTKYELAIIFYHNCNSLLSYQTTTLSLYYSN